jgi:hypothetical protein
MVTALTLGHRYSQIVEKEKEACLQRPSGPTFVVAFVIDIRRVFADGHESIQVTT